MIRACDEGNLEIVQYLVENGADVNYHDDSGDSPLICATVIGSKPTTKLLLSSSVDVNAINRLGATALGYAQHHGHHSVEKLLADAGAVDIKNE